MYQDQDVKDLIAAAKQAVACWGVGDLAGAIRLLGEEIAYVEQNAASAPAVSRAAGPEKKVTWRVEVDADTPEEAAMAALKMQRDPSSTATVFEVQDGESVVQVDLSNWSEDHDEHEGWIAELMASRIDSGDLDLGDIPDRLAQYGLTEPSDFIAEMRERKEMLEEDEAEESMG